jgi:putative membrane protein
MKRYGFLPIALTAALAIGCNSGHKDTSTANPANGGAVGTAGTEDHNLSRGDKDFVNDLAVAGTAEVELGRMAAERAVNPDVKKFGQMMVDDHTKANDELTQLASQHNIPVPTDLDDKHRDLRDKLSKLQGADFDKEYMDAMVDGHDDVLGKLRSRVDKDTLEKTKVESRDQNGKKAEAKVNATAILPEKSDNPVTMSINEWAAKTYPVVNAHLEQAKTLRDTVKKRMTH